MDEQTQLPNIPSYEMVRILGQGGMATVYLAVQESFGRPVALKVMSPHLLAQRDFADRFHSEARMVASLSHPNIITVYDVGVHEQYHYMAMEYHTGGHLGELIEKGEIDAERALKVTRDLAVALAFAHDNGIVHRDLKPDNVLFSKLGAPILTDFGIARDLYVDSQMTQIGSTVGTPKYMSPEQAKGERVDGRADLYSLGVMLYEMLLGEPPFTAQDTVTLAIKHCQDPVPPLPLNLDRYQQLLDRLLAKEARYRFQTGLEVRDAVEALLNAPTATAYPQAAPMAQPTGEFAPLPTAKPKPTAAPVVAPPSQSFYRVSDEVVGSFFNKKIVRRVNFSADDYEEFGTHFQKMADELNAWMQEVGKKADTLHMSIEAHPWIHKRIIDKIRADFSAGHGYGDFAKRGTVTLHLYDALDPTGKQYLVRTKGQQPAAS
ncbi:MAG: protein kinase [Pseudomonadota bacterium]|nr:protein kinase [Pseudomonadota bacterium]